VPRGIYVPLPSREREALFTLADNEWRSPREQAAKILVEGLRKAGALPTEPTPITGPLAAVEAGK
jgi:hypothetical protein